VVWVCGCIILLTDPTPQRPLGFNDNRNDTAKETFPLEYLIKYTASQSKLLRFTCRLHLVNAPLLLLLLLLMMVLLPLLLLLLLLLLCCAAACSGWCLSFRRYGLLWLKNIYLPFITQGMPTNFLMVGCLLHSLKSIMTHHDSSRINQSR
jgi:hypothetical protein